MNENDLFDAWRAAPDNKDLEGRLVEALRLYARRLVFKFLGTYSPEIENTAVYQALTYSHQFRGDAKFTTWFYPVVHNLCSKELRRKIVERERNVPIEDAENIGVDSEPEVEITLDEVLEELDEMDQRIAQLKLEGFKESEIAAQLGVTEDSVRNRWRRLKLKILGQSERKSG